MPKVFITGYGGVGKSTVINHLKDRGYTAYDTDDVPGATRLEDKAGKSLEWPAGYVDWYKYRWNWQRPQIEKLLASNETVFLGGMPSNWQEFINDFDTIIVLTRDPKEQEHRLKTRNVHKHGQDEKNIAENVWSQKHQLGKFILLGAVIVKNARPIDEVVDEILSYIHES